MPHTNFFHPSRHSKEVPGGHRPLNKADGLPDFEAGDLAKEDPALYPAKSYGDLIGQLQRLGLVFTEHEGRDPDPTGDPEFWSAFETLCKGFARTSRPTGSGPNA